jgi:TolB protein
MGQHLAAQDQLLAEPADPAALRGGWHDRDGDGVISAGDELLIDIFRPGTNERVFDFSDACFVRSESLPLGALTKAAELPRPRCGYKRWHIDTLLSGRDVAGTDGMSFSPDGSKLVLPIRHAGHYQIQVTRADGTGAVCLTCDAPGTNDGVRWQPGGDALLFVSDRDHPFSQGGAGGGVGQELYVMRSDGSHPTRLTHSHAWATNYHANWSMDGRRIVWGNTESHAWDVMVADYVEDAAGPRLANVKRLAHDTTWWETHGFSVDGRSIIATNTRAGFMSPDLYAIDIATGQRTRLTDDPAWDEHAHLSPDGRKLAWISGRWQPASVLRLNRGQLWPLFDFFWIVPGIFFEILNHPAGYATELTLMDADGKQVQRLTFEGEIAADNEWSPDGRRILFRQQQPRLFGAGRIRILTFDDCEPSPSP